MKTKPVMFLLLFCLVIGLVIGGCSDEYNPVGVNFNGNGGNNDTSCVGPHPKPIYIPVDVNLAVSPNDNNDQELVVTGLDREAKCDAFVYVNWRSNCESDMTFTIDNQPYALPDPMIRPAEGWVRFTGVKIDDSLVLGLSMDKGSAKKFDFGSDQKNANQVVKVVFSTIGLRE